MEGHSKGSALRLAKLAARMVLLTRQIFVYTQNRLEWHLGERLESLNPIVFCAVLSDDKRTFDSSQSFVVALAKSQDHRVNYGVFAFGQSNAVRRWFDLRYSVTRANQSRERGRISRAWWF